MRLESYVYGQWTPGQDVGRALVNPVTGAGIATADSTGVDCDKAMHYARTEGVGALASMTFAERGALLKEIAAVLQNNREDYGVIARLNSGNTRTDASVDIDGAIFTLKHYARLARGLGEVSALHEPGEDALSKDPVFFARHIWNTRPGVAVQINAFNFPAWGLWEKIAQATVAGVPSIAKPATSTAMLSERMMRDVVEADLVPGGVISLICGRAEGLTAALGPMDSLAFTGSAATGMTLRRQVAERAAAPRISVEADSVNATILGPDAAPGSVLFDLAVREVIKALSVKAGQLCTNIRRVFVAENSADAFAEAVADKVRKLRVGDPRDENVRVGPLVNSAQRAEAAANIEQLRTETDLVAASEIGDVAPASGFFAPTLLRCADPRAAHAAHTVEVFGPCTTIMPYDNLADAVTLGTRAEGSLALSVFSDDEKVQTALAHQLGPWHGRVLIVDSDVGKAHSGHAIVMPQCVHGGPGRAGGGEELGGRRGLRFHMQRTAVQASRAALDRVIGVGGEAAL